MRRLIIFIVGPVLILFAVLIVTTVTLINRTPYSESVFYEKLIASMDSVDRNLHIGNSSGPCLVGWAKTNITPRGTYPLAGYGARDPKEVQAVHDSSYVRTIILERDGKKVALVSADLLIIHPEVSLAVYERLPDAWSAQNVYFTATHTHSGIGSWAPGLVGTLFSGEYNPAMVDWLAERICHSIETAEKSLQQGGISYGNLHVGDLVKNRMITDGPEDSLLHILKVQKGQETGIFTSFGAHATCYSETSHVLSGDYPGQLVQMLESDSGIQFAAFGAGAMGSMGPDANNSREEICADFLADELADQLKRYLRFSQKTDSVNYLASFRLPLPHRDPYFKLTENLAARPFLFRHFFGDYENYVSVLVIDSTVFIGLPCDFSGELALPLYQQARSLGLNLVLTSFNGGYMGYVVRDDRYELNNYEARTMSWYGPDTGSYLSEVISRLLVIIDHKLN